MIGITSYNWEITDTSGTVVETSTLRTPHFRLTTGIYNATLTLGVDGDDDFVITKLNYITVKDDSFNLITDGYFDSPISLTLGFDNNTGFGWSENVGKQWLWPESKYSILTKQINGVTHTVVWDIYDNKQYVMDISDTANFSATYMDKDVYEIPTFIRTQDMSGDMIMDSMNHEETSIRMRPARELDEYREDLTIDMSLFIDNSDTPVETRADIDPTKETTFYYNNEKIHDTNIRQIGISTTTSGYSIEAIESVFRRARKFKSATDPYTDVFNLFNTNTTHWLTRGDYGRDRGTGELVKYVEVVPDFDDVITYPNLDNATLIIGPDNIVESAIFLRDDYTPNVWDGKTGTLMFWSNQTVMAIDGITFTKQLDNGDWTLYYSVCTIPTDFTLPSGLAFFDARLLDVDITTLDNPDEMFENYSNHLERYLPGC